MQVATQEPLYGYDGKPLLGPKDAPVTLGMLIRQVMNSPVQDEPWTPDTMMKCAELSRRAMNEDHPDFDETERALIKERAGKVYALVPDGPQVYTLLHEALSDPPAPALSVAASDE